MIKSHQVSKQLLKMPSKVIGAKCSSTNPQNLPRLPVPKLSDTLTKYLDAVEPHLDVQRFEKTKNIVAEFGKNGGIGEKLQQLLEKRAETKENWLSDPTSNWFLDCTYLQYRDPVAVWSSPGFVFPQRKFVTLDDKIRYSAQVISAALQHKKKIDTKQIPIDKVGKTDHDMQQHEKIFGTCRIPGLPVDSLQFHSDSKHIILAINDAFFKVPVYAQEDGSILGENQIEQQIKDCLKLIEAEKLKNSVKIGILTSDNRENWAKAYLELIKNKANEESLAEIQESLFVLSIDREMPQIEDDITTGCHQSITGGGSKYNSANRWFDKTIQFFIGSTGINGLTFEHSPADGVPPVVLVESIIKYLSDQESGIKKPTSRYLTYEKPKLITFQSSPSVDESIRVSSENIDKLSADLDMSYLRFAGYGKNFIKSQNFSPDSFIQMAIQFAFYRLHFVPGAQYESATTRIYLHGRTDVVRSCSKESLAFSKAMVEGKNDQEKVQLLKNAINVHKKQVTEAVQGLGISNHLLGLKLIAGENNIPIPELYSDEGYTKSSSYRLSTSQVAPIYEMFICYGPLTRDGYGCCYLPRNDVILFGLSSLISNPVTSTQKFKKSLEEALQIMQQLLLDASSKQQPIRSKL